MKKMLTVMLALVLSVSAAGFAACGKDEGGKFTFYAPDGAPALAIAKFIKENENFGEEYEFSYSVVSSDKIGGIMQKGTGDFIIMPVNAASKLYKADADNPYKMVSVLTHGNLYIMSKSDSTLESLKGKVVGVIGQGLVPDLTFKYILKKAGIEYVVSDSAENGKVALRYFSHLLYVLFGDMSTLFQPKIFLSRRFSAADMPFGEIFAERFLHFPVQTSVKRIKTFGYVFMYGRL